MPNTYGTKLDMQHPKRNGDARDTARYAPTPAPVAAAHTAHSVSTHPGIHNHGGILHHDDHVEHHPVERFVMCPPKYLSTAIPNNVWMKNEPIDRARAMKQYARVVNVIEALGVEVFEINPVQGLQDQTYVANVAVAIEPHIILANYKAPGRSGEVAPARELYRKLGYKSVIQPPFHFEGEADIKKLKDGVYFGGFGKFTDIRTHKWIADKCGVEVIPVREVSDKLYHLDCSLLPVDEENLLIVKEGLDKYAIKQLEKHANLTFTPNDIAITGATNCVLIPEKNLCLSGMFNPEDKIYRKGMEWMNATFDKFGYTCMFLDVDEADKSGADLSCMVMHLTF